MRRFIPALTLLVMLGVSCNCIGTQQSQKSLSSEPVSDPPYHSSVYSSRLTEHRYKVTMRLVKFCPNGLFFYGTGVIVSSDQVITAKHMIECIVGKDAKGKVKVVDSLYLVGHRSDGRKVKLKPYWREGYLDVAVLQATSWLNYAGKVDLGEHATIDRKRLKVGDWLCYVGGGARVEVVLTKCGEVFESSAMEFAVGLHTFGGNSGGPLFNKEGKLVGIMYGRQDTDLEGYGVPISAVPEVLPTPEKKQAPKTTVVEAPMLP